MYKEIVGACNIFDSLIKSNKIDLIIEGDRTLKYTGWVSDIYAIFGNLIDNSILGISKTRSTVRTINILIDSSSEPWQIIYQDSGPGIEPHLLDSGVIFEPEFTTKPTAKSSMGIGLSIAGESAYRNDLELTALESKDGALFKLSPVLENNREADVLSYEVL